jgi:hypothetical protein
LKGHESMPVSLSVPAAFEVHTIISLPTGVSFFGLKFGNCTAPEVERKEKRIVMPKIGVCGTKARQSFFRICLRYIYSASRMNIFYLRRSPRMLRKKLPQTNCTPKVSEKADSMTMRSKCALSKRPQCPLAQSETA